MGCQFTIVDGIVRILGGDGSGPVDVDAVRDGKERLQVDLGDDFLPAGGGGGGSTIDKRLRIKELAGVTLSASDATIFTDTGSGRMAALWLHFTNGKVRLKITVDSVNITDGIDEAGYIEVENMRKGTGWGMAPTDELPLHFSSPAAGVVKMQFGSQTLSWGSTFTVKAKRSGGGANFLGGEIVWIDMDA